MESFNLYMDEFSYPAGGDDPDVAQIQFRVEPASVDKSDSTEDAVLAGLDIIDLIDLRNALQEVIDVVAIAALDPAAGDIPG